MVEYILGNYLVENKIATAEKMKNILDRQDEFRVKLGVIAIEEGILTKEQADEINRLQVVMDQRFGNIAVAKGYMTEAQVTDILSKQGSNYMHLVQSLVDEEVCSQKQLEEIWDKFAKEHDLTAEDVVALKDDDVEKIAAMMIPEAASKYAQLLGNVLNIIIRQIDRHAYFEKCEFVTEFDAVNQVSQAMVSDDGIVDSFSEDNGGLLELARIFGKEDFSELDLDALDAAGELLNCANGLFSAAMSRQGTFFELMPPLYEELDVELEKASILKVTINVKGKKMFWSVGTMV